MSRMRWVMLLGMVAAGGFATGAAAADQPIDARSLVLRHAPNGREILELRSKDDDVPFPDKGDDDDPTVPGSDGAVLDLFGGDGQVATIVLPGGSGVPGWKAKKGRRKSAAYRYLNPSAPEGPSSVKLLVVQDGVGMLVNGRATGLDLSGALGRVGVRLTMGSLRMCALFDESTVVHDRPGRFAARGALAATLADCSDASLAGVPELPETTTSTSTTTTTTTSTSTSTTVPGLLFGNYVEYPDASQHSPGFLLGSKINVPSPMTVTHLAVIAKAGGANVMMGLYRASGGAPTTLVVGTAPTALVPGAMEIPVTPTALTAGNYFLMAMYDTDASVGIDVSDANASAMFAFQDFSAGLPSSVPFASALFGQRYNYYLRAVP